MEDPNGTLGVFNRAQLLSSRSLGGHHMRNIIAQTVITPALRLGTCCLPMKRSWDRQWVDPDAISATFSVTDLLPESLNNNLACLDKFSVPAL